MTLFRDTFFLKSAELLISVFEICAELKIPFEKTCKNYGYHLGKILQNYWDLEMKYM